MSQVPGSMKGGTDVGGVAPLPHTPSEIGQSAVEIRVCLTFNNGVPP